MTLKKTQFLSVAQAAVLIVVGCMQLAGDLLGLETMKALGAISHASPAPKVFTSHRGYETYTPEFFVAAVQADGSRQEIQLTPQVNSRLRGPYNRRNAYGAALSYGPVLASDERTRGMFESALWFALCGPSGLVDEVGLPTAPHYEISVVQRRASQPNEFDAPAMPTRFEVSCSSRGVVAR